MLVVLRRGNGSVHSPGVSEENRIGKSHVLILACERVTRSLAPPLPVVVLHRQRSFRASVLSRLSGNRACTLLTRCFLLPRVMLNMTIMVWLIHQKKGSTFF